LCARGIERLREGAAIAGQLLRFARTSESLGVACACRRREGADVKQLGVLAAADPLEFVGTRRLEEEAGGAYTWRSILSGWFRSPLPFTPRSTRLSPLFARRTGPGPGARSRPAARGPAGPAATLHRGEAAPRMERGWWRGASGARGVLQARSTRTDGRRTRRQSTRGGSWGVAGQVPHVGGGSPRHGAA